MKYLKSRGKRKKLVVILLFNEPLLLHLVHWINRFLSPHFATEPGANISWGGKMRSVNASSCSRDKVTIGSLARAVKGGFWFHVTMTFT